MEITKPDKKQTGTRKRTDRTHEEIMNRLLFMGFWGYLLLVAILAMRMLK